VLQLCQQPSSIQAVLPEHDDLLFFVYWNDISKEKGSRIFARRKLKLKNNTNSSNNKNKNSLASALPLDLAWNTPLAAEIDWRSSLLLNIVLQTQYFLTVVRCPPFEVDQILDRTGTPLKKSVKQLESHQSTHSRQSIHITKRVHASPSTTPVNLDQTKSSDAAPSVSYPNICFAVDDFVEAFDCLILDDAEEDYYCVVLHADVTNTWSKAAVGENQGKASEAVPSLSRVEVEATPTSKSLEALFEERLSLKTHVSSSSVLHNSTSTSVGTISVFNGYVSCKQLTTALKSYLGNPLKHFFQQRKKGEKGGQRNTAKVLMRGPGGVGSAEVAVTALRSENSARESLAELVFKSAVEAVKTAVHQGGEESSSGTADAAMKLQCALMAVNIPVEALAEQILKSI
jgi:hypothetical protein